MASTYTPKKISNLGTINVKLEVIGMDECQDAINAWLESNGHMTLAPATLEYARQAIQTICQQHLAMSMKLTDSHGDPL